MTLTLAVCASTSRAIFAFNIYTVGQGCPFSKIQDAVDAAAASPGEDYVWIVNNKLYTSQYISIVDQDVDIEGGFSDCSDFSIGPNDSTTIYGTTQPVFSIGGNSHVYLGNLRISEGNTYDGGGVNFNGQGSLALAAITISFNTATFGGGIYFAGSTGPATLTLLDGTNITSNTAESGGGIFLNGNARLLARSTSVSIDHNHAEIGGGITIGTPARADLGITNGFAAAINQNGAGDGGGIALYGAVLRVFSPDAAHPSAINGNIAARYGGGIFAQQASQVCLFNVAMESNQGLQGAAIFEYGTGSGIYINRAFPNAPGPECGPETVAALGGEPYACDSASASCNYFFGNKATDQFDRSTGPIIYQHGGAFAASRLRLQDSFGTSALQTESVTTNVDTSLFSDNDVSAALISVAGGTASLSASTFAHDTIGGTYVFDFGSGPNVVLKNDIIAEPGHLSVTASAPPSASYVLSNDITTLPHNSSVIADTPKFVDSTYFDYHLRPDSPGLDFAPAAAGTDLDEHSRTVDLPGVANRFGPTDLGAFERQYLYLCDSSTDVIFCDAFEASP